MIMGKQTVNALVDGGKATPSPPLGPSLSPLKVNIPKIISEINAKTKSLEGMKVPVKIIVDTDTKDFDIIVGTPPVAALVKKEIKIEKGSGTAGSARAGDLSMEQVKKIAKMKFGSDSESYVSQVIGTCRSMGITIGKGKLTQEEVKLAEKSRTKKEEAAPKAEAAAPAAATAAPKADIAKPGKPAKAEAKPAAKPGKTEGKKKYV